uniref:Uncharacterized protein n=1 Tax=Arundo donax TaxID=35708 RepID=A0A0A9A445_ARUDO
MEVLTSLQLPAAYAHMRPNKSNIIAASSVCRWSRNLLWTIMMTTKDATKAAELL